MIAVLAGLSGGLVTHTVAKPQEPGCHCPRRRRRSAAWRRTRRTRTAAQNDGGNTPGNGAQMILFFGGAEPGSGSESGESGSSGPAPERRKRIRPQIETTVQLGIYRTGVTEDVPPRRMTSPSGVVAADFSEENSNAEKAGLQKGDVIRKIDDTGVPV